MVNVWRKLPLKIVYPSDCSFEMKLCRFFAWNQRHCQLVFQGYSEDMNKRIIVLAERRSFTNRSRQFPKTILSFSKIRNA